ncbi:MAG TPA: hypothetical protein DEQ80_11790 [Anaerolinea thermolimosa]|uniref:Uncharacterized protein n=1 Tax=Anaerolinea thermolimosa TaxID=229919 RepID=A0A3D1JIX1_9CHLR|nr:hypothetical protein [Anaerolinea thermolimosa]
MFTQKMSNDDALRYAKAYFPKSLVVELERLTYQTEPERAHENLARFAALVNAARRDIERGGFQPEVKNVMLEMLRQEAENGLNAIRANLTKKLAREKADIADRLRELEDEAAGDNFQTYLSMRWPLLQRALDAGRSVAEVLAASGDRRDAYVLRRNLPLLLSERYTGRDFEIALQGALAEIELWERGKMSEQELKLRDRLGRHNSGAYRVEVSLSQAETALASDPQSGLPFTGFDGEVVWLHPDGRVNETPPQGIGQ